MFKHVLVLLRYRRTLFSLVVLLLCGGLLMDGELLLLTRTGALKFDLNKIKLRILICDLFVVNPALQTAGHS
ncbi:hypothetical protein E2C01_061406 [Portunus trituberculatus]|uniref:Uncharacterized protein n=1 Tax=Portunus trituberculatus TaxID=210409 RepID=A0A5B7HB71_PORTR|nr:hypothetical protein [Portunus trituberculatus]